MKNIVVYSSTFVDDRRRNHLVVDNSLSNTVHDNRNDSDHGVVNTSSKDNKKIIERERKKDSKGARMASFENVLNFRIKNNINMNKYSEKEDDHRVINSSTGAVGVDVDGINVEMAIVTGTLAAMVDAEDRNEDECGRMEFDEENSSI